MYPFPLLFNSVYLDDIATTDPIILPKDYPFRVYDLVLISKSAQGLQKQN